MTAQQRETVVVAAKRSHFEAWCIDNGRRDRDPTLIPVTSLRDLDRVWGRSDFDIAWCTAPERDADEIAATLRACQQRSSRAPLSDHTDKT